MPAIFRFLMEAGPVDPREAYATFNMGIGFAVYVAPARGAGGARGGAGHRLRRLGRRDGCAGTADARRSSIPSLGLEFEGDTLQVR